MCVSKTLCLYCLLLVQPAKSCWYDWKVVDWVVIQKLIRIHLHCLCGFLIRYSFLDHLFGTLPSKQPISSLTGGVWYKYSSTSIYMDCECEQRMLSRDCAEVFSCFTQLSVKVIMLRYVSKLKRHQQHSMGRKALIVLHCKK